MKRISIISILFLVVSQTTIAQNISTYAGGNIGDNILATYAILKTPYKCAVDAAGNIYIADNADHRIRKISTSGVMSTIAGTGTFGFSGDNGISTNAKIYNPTGIAVDNSGNIYFADYGNKRIRKIVASTGMITTIAGNGSYQYSGDGGLAINAGLTPFHIAIDQFNNIYFSDISNQRVRKINSLTGLISTVAGNGSLGYGGDNGPAISASLKSPSGITVDSFGNLFIADRDNYRIRKVNASGIITTVAGNGISDQSGDSGPATSAGLLFPIDVTLDANGNIFVSDYKNPFGFGSGQGSSKIRRIASATGIITTVVGNGTNGFSGDGNLAINASLKGPMGVTVAQNGDLIIADGENQRIRRVYSSTGIINTIGGQGYGNGFYGDGGAATNSMLSGPGGTAIDVQGNLYIADTYNRRIRKVNKSTGIITTIAGNGIAAISGDNGLATNASLYLPLGVAVDNNGNIYILDYLKVRKVTISTGIITTVAGNGSYGYSGDGGLAINATFKNPEGIDVDVNGNIFIADTQNHVVRMVSASTGIITTIAGNGSPGFSGDFWSPISAQLYQPTGVVVDDSGVIYIADSENQRIRKISYLPYPVNNVIISTIGGTGNTNNSGDGGSAINADLSRPKNVALDNQGNLFISTYYNVRKISLSTGIINGVAGYGQGGDGALAYNAVLNIVNGLAVDNKGVLYISDGNTSKIRKVQATASINFTNTSQTYSGTGKSVSTSTNPTGLIVNVTYNGSTTLPVNAGSYTVVATVTGPDPDYYGLATTTLTINKATLTVTAANKTKNYGAVNPALTLTYSGFQNGETASIIDASPTPTTTATTLSNVGVYPIIPAGGSDNNYNFSFSNGTLTINKTNVTITANNTSKTYGSPNPGFTLSYSGFQNGETSSVIDTPPTSTTTATVISNAGNYPIIPAGGLDNNYTFTYINGILTINKALLTVTANNASRTYGAVNPSLTITYSGFVNSETASVIDVLPNASTTATITSNVGTYPIIPTGGADNNYSFSYVNGILSINKAALIATANNTSRNYGVSNPVFIITYSGFQNGETATVIDSPPIASSVATISSNAGTYPISLSGGVDNNYTISNVNGTLTVNKANLSVIATNVSRIYGAPNPPLSFVYSGFFNGETSAVIDTPPSITTTAVTGSNTGTYPITAAGGLDNNYIFSYVNGTLTINPATLTITAGNASRTYGAGNPVISINYSGFVNGETLSVIDVQPSVSTTATVTSNVGIYPTIPSGGSDNNYSFSYANGSLTINKAILVVQANNASKEYLQPNPSFSISYSGFVNSENMTVLDSQPTISTTATASSSPGNYPIVPSGGFDNNYLFSFINGTLTINAPPPPSCSVYVNTSGDLCANGRVKLSAVASGGTPSSYSWSTGESSSSIWVYDGGDYSVTVYFSSGCTESASTYIDYPSGDCIYYRKAAPDPVILKPENLDFENIKIYPNPANESFVIELPGKAESRLPVSIIDQVGRPVQEASFEKGEQTKTVRTQDLAGGIYVVQIGAGKSGVIRKKVMVVHKN